MDPHLFALDDALVIRPEAFRKTFPGESCDLFTLSNGAGLVVQITNYGCKIVSLLVPDRHHRWSDIVLGYDDIETYRDGNPYFGALIGRYANRIAGAAFSLHGTRYSLARNDGLHHLHGGIRGFHDRIWRARQSGPDCLELTYFSPDGEEGYPGNLEVQVRYRLTPANELILEYRATTDRPTVINLTNHSFFNLAGAGVSTILDTLLTINADRFTPVDEHFIPTGQLWEVSGTPLDFRTPAAIGARIDEDYSQLRWARGYDHNYQLNKNGSELSFAARAFEPVSGRIMEVYTTEPGLQLYSGNRLTGRTPFVGKGGKPYPRYGAFCLETQRFPDAINQPGFPSPVLNPGERYTSVTIYKFTTAG
ncbi:aldose 1-epimerase [Hydrogenispora ethanolica]|jgi:aldose 1-epimerase|uniref:Aldose 1-epimerase n=1 Tax=Hydrogenispora ethanolica TaxID=1082276 RepID=A0A4R1QW24_HYDET|nr:aldose epimerase family protein [Hydrogenispora ethanolica]TCL57867.1 aldose 1-epimerase [Hydrogenispora ethanolica]